MARKQARAAQREDYPERRPSWWRSALAWLFVLLFSVAAPLAVVAGWTRLTLFDTDRYVSTVAPLASDPRIQDAVVAMVEEAVAGPAPTPEDSPASGSLVPPDAAEVVAGLLGVRSAAAATPPPAIVRATRVATATAPPEPTPTASPRPSATTEPTATAVATATAAPAPAATPVADTPAGATPASLLDQATQAIGDAVGAEANALVREASRDVAGAVVRSPEFASAWSEANEKAQQELMKVDGSTGPVTLGFGSLGPAIERELASRNIPGISSIPIPQADLSVEVLDEPSADALRATLGRIDVAGIVLPVVALVALILALVIGQQRLAVVRRLGFGAAIGAIVTLLALFIAQQAFVGRTADAAAADAAQAVVQAVLRTPVWMEIGLAVVGIAVGVLAMVTDFLVRGRRA